MKNDRPELTQGQTPACPGPGRGCSVEWTKRGDIQEKCRIWKFCGSYTITINQLEPPLMLYMYLLGINS